MSCVRNGVTHAEAKHSRHRREFSQDDTETQFFLLVLQVLFDHALTSSVILYNKSRDVFTMAETSRAIVRDVTLFVLVAVIERTCFDVRLVFVATHAATVLVPQRQELVPLVGLHGRRG